jgi:hypothetical protein
MSLPARAWLSSLPGRYMVTTWSAARALVRRLKLSKSVLEFIVADVKCASGLMCVKARRELSNCFRDESRIEC